MHDDHVPLQVARLQQGIALGSLLFASTWFLACWRQGWPASAFAGAGLIVCAYAAVLAVEFLLLRATHGDDQAPRATATQLLSAWWGELTSAPRVFYWRQPFCSLRWPDQLPAQAHGRRGVLFIHGLVCNRGIWNPWLQRLTAQGVPFAAVSLQPVFGNIDDYMPAIDNAVRRLEHCTGLAPIVVAHSMGGLVLRRWWATQDGNPARDNARIYQAITIATPHQGTWLARFGSSRNARQMQQGSRWLAALRNAEPVTRAHRFICFYGHCDNIVFPPSLATLAGADNRHLPVVAHVQMVDAVEPWNELQRLLQQPVAPTSTQPA